MSATTNPPAAETGLTPDLIDRVMKLPPADKEKLYDLLAEEVGGPEEVRRAWREEIARRWERYKSGEERSYTIEEVMADLCAQAERRQT